MMKKIQNSKSKMRRKMKIKFGMMKKIFSKKRNKKMKILSKSKAKFIKIQLNLVRRVILHRSNRKFHHLKIVRKSIEK